MIEAVRRERDVTVEQPYWKLFEKALLVLVVIEVALGGNGYLIQLDGMRLRVLLFPICMAWTLLRLTRIDPVRVPFEVVCLFAFFVALTIFDTAIGYYHGNQVTAIVAEVKPLSYFPMLFFFIATIQKRSDVTLVAGLLAGCGTLLAVLYLLTIASVRFGFIDDYSLWQFLHVSDEFIFRGFPVIGFLYKGAIYIAIAAIFLIFDPFKVTNPALSLARRSARYGRQ